MESDRSVSSIRRSAPAALVGILLGVAPLAWAQTPPAGGARIYTCIDANGKRLTSDRTIPECVAREQRVLNSDGSVKQVVPPTPTADERAEQEARERDAQAARVAQQDAVRRDRNLIARFPNEVAHRKAREIALDDIRASVRASEARVKRLTLDRKPLTDEAEFYVGKAMPIKLKAQLDANDAALEAQRSLIQNQEVEVDRINALYDAELSRLKRLWAGAPAGSMGPVAATATATTPAAATVSAASAPRPVTRQ